MTSLLELMAPWLFSFLPAMAVAPDGYYVDVPFRHHSDLVPLVDQGYDLGGIDFERKIATLVIRPGEVKRTAALQVVAQRMVGRPDTGFKKPKDIERYLTDIARDYPHLARLEEIGKSAEGQTLYAMQLTSRFAVTDKPKTKVLIDAMHHAREVMTPEIALDLIDYLTSRHETDPKVQKWMHQLEVWVVPMINPDGNQKVWNSQPMWRKNTNHGNGVDVNRNYPHDWNKCGGSSGSPSNETYRGPSASSEPETKAIMELTTKIKPKLAISYHSFSEIVIYPFGCSPKRVPSPDREKYEGLGKELAKKLVRDSGSGTFTPGTSYDLLYNVDGGSVDWMYAQEGVFAYVIEVNSSTQGFQPSFSWRQKTVERQRPGWQLILDKALESRVL